MSPGEAVHLGHLEPEEISFLGNVASTLSLDDHGIDALWLRVTPGWRWWIVETPVGRVTYRTATSHPDDASPDSAVQRWLPIPERIIRVAVASPGIPDLAHLTLVDGTTAVLTCPTTSAAIDLVAGVGAPTTTSWVSTSDVAVPTNRLAGLLWAAFAVPNAAFEQRLRPYPPMWLRLDGDGITFHVDWNDAGSGRSTFRCDGDFDGEPVTVPIPPRLLHSFVHQLLFETHSEPSDALCVVTVGELAFDDDAQTRRQVVEIRRGPAALTVWINDPLVVRWGAEVANGIAAADVELLGNEDGDWLLRSFGVDVRVALHHGHPDHIRVSAVLCTGVAESIDLLREVNQLNAVSRGPRFVVTDSTVRAMTDIACLESDAISAALTRVIDEIVTETRRYAPLLGALVGT